MQCLVPNPQQRLHDRLGIGVKISAGSDYMLPLRPTLGLMDVREIA
jgi:hypothetical protein